MVEKTSEQQARDLLERMGIDGAQAMTDNRVAPLVELLDATHEKLVRANAQWSASVQERLGIQKQCDWLQIECDTLRSLDPADRAAASLKLQQSQIETLRREKADVGRKASDRETKLTMENAKLTQQLRKLVTV